MVNYPSILTEQAWEKVNAKVYLFCIFWMGFGMLGEGEKDGKLLETIIRIVMLWKIHLIFRAHEKKFVKIYLTKKPRDAICLEKQFDTRFKS